MQNSPMRTSIMIISLIRSPETYFIFNDNIVLCMLRKKPALKRTSFVRSLFVFHECESLKESVSTLISTFSAPLHF